MIHELQINTTSRQVRRLELLASVSGVSLADAFRAALYLGVEKALDERAEHGQDLATVHMINKILAVEEVGAVDTSDHDAIDKAVADQALVMERLINR